MLNFDEKEIAQLLVERGEEDEFLAPTVAKQLKNVHKYLYPIVESWIRGEKVAFDFEGITLEFILKHDRCTVVQAILRMSDILKNPNLIDLYTDFEPFIDYVE